MAARPSMKALKQLNPLCAVAVELGLEPVGRRAPAPDGVACACASPAPDVLFDPETHAMRCAACDEKLGSVIDLVMAVRHCDQDGARDWLQARAESRGLADMQREGVILVDHGSRFEAANAMLLDVAATLQVRAPDLIIHVAHMEIAPPTIADAYAACVQDGARTVVVHPYFLVPGQHAMQDIPRQAAEAAVEFPDVPHRVSPPLGLHPAIADVILARVSEA